MTASPCPKWPQPAVSAKSSPAMLPPSVVDGTANVGDLGALFALPDGAPGHALVTPGTGVSRCPSSGTARSRPRAADAASYRQRPRRR